MNKKLLFNVLNRNVECFYISQSRKIDSNRNYNIRNFDIYVKIDISNFTVYDTLEKASFYLKVYNTYETMDFYLYETSDIDFDSINDLTDLNSDDKDYNNNYIEHINLTNDKDEVSVCFDITKLLNENILLHKSYVYFRIYHDKTKSIKIRAITKESVTGTIRRFKEIEYDSYSLGLTGTASVALLNGMLRLSLPSFDLGNKILPFNLTFTYS